MNKKSNLNNWMSVILGFFAFIFETFILLLYLFDILNIYFVIFVHIVIIILLFLFVHLAYKQQKDLLYPLLLLLSTLGAGPFGLAIFLLTVLFRPLLSVFTITPEGWFLGLFPEHNFSPFRLIYQRVKSGWDDYNLSSEITSFKNTFIYGTIAQKQSTLDAIIKDYQPCYSSILLQALADPNNTVRIQAAAIISKIENNNDLKLQALLAKKNLNQNDEENLKLAEFCEEYINLGFIDSLKKKELGHLAVSLYKDHLNKYPDDSAVSCAVGQLLFLMKDYNEYILWFNEHKKRFKKTSEMAFIQYREVLYKLQRYDLLSLETL